MKMVKIATSFIMLLILLSCSKKETNTPVPTPAQKPQITTENSAKPKDTLVVAKIIEPVKLKAEKPRQEPETDLSKSPIPIVNEKVEVINKSISMADYDNIKTDMMLNEVEKLLDKKGKLIKVTSAYGYTVSTYQWVLGEKGKSINIVFVNGKVNKKIQIGLK